MRSEMGMKSKQSSEVLVLQAMVEARESLHQVKEGKYKLSEEHTHKQDTMLTRYS